MRSPSRTRLCLRLPLLLGWWFAWSRFVSGITPFRGCRGALLATATHLVRVERFLFLFGSPCVTGGGCQKEETDPGYSSFSSERQKTSIFERLRPVLRYIVKICPVREATSSNVMFRGSSLFAAHRPTATALEIFRAAGESSLEKEVVLAIGRSLLGFR